jgi:hypothetical protein
VPDRVKVDAYLGLPHADQRIRHDVVLNFW